MSNEYWPNVPGTTRMTDGGTVHFAKHFSEYLTSEGHEWIGLVHTVVPTEQKTSVRKLVAIENKSFYECTFPASRRDVFQTLEKRQDPCVWFGEQIQQIRRFMKRAKADILFLNGYSILAWMMLEAAAQEGIPIVIQHAGIAQIEYELYKHLYSNMFRKMYLDMERRTVELASKQVFLNEFSRKMFCEKVAPVPKEQSIIIPLPFDASFVEKGATSERPRVQKTTNVFTIGCVARWDRIKNHKAILALAKEAKKEGLPWKWKTITRIPESMTHHRFKQAYRKAIEVVPPMDRAALKEFYQSVDFLVLPSLFDVSPTVVMEAALVGRPTLISTGVGWVSEYSVCGLSPWIVDFRDPKKVIQRIRLLQKQPLSSQFRRQILTKHASKKVFDAYLRVFNAVR